MEREKIDLDTPLRDLNFSARCLQCFRSLYDEPLLTVRDLCTQTGRELRRFRNFGRISESETEDILEYYGLRLGMSDEELAEYEGKSLKKDEPQEKQEADAINWEERRWGLVAMNMPDEVDYNGRWKRIFDKTIYIADEWIKMYKKQLEKERKHNT